MYVLCHITHTTAISPLLSAPVAQAEHLDESCSPSVSHIAVRNRFFGSSGRASKPQGKLLIESFQKFNSFVSSKDGARRVVHKMLANTACVQAMATHYPTVVKNSSDCR